MAVTIFVEGEHDNKGSRVRGSKLIRGREKMRSDTAPLSTSS
jgi:hypothetical protein